MLIRLGLRCRQRSSLSLPYLADCRLYHRRAPEPSSAEMTELLARYASTPPRPLNLTQLLSFGDPVSQDSVLESVKYALLQLPKRLSTRIRSLEALPFIVGTNPYVTKTLNAYKESFQWLATHPPVTTIQENDEFVEQLTAIVERHANDIPTMAKGCVLSFPTATSQLNLCSFQECSRYMSPKQISDFLDGAIRNRISVRLIAEQHIAVSHALEHPNRPSAYVGVLDMKCSPKSMVKMCASFVTDLCEATLGASPTIVIDGYTDATFA
jgi:26S proteasome regulatory subunit T1